MSAGLQAPADRILGLLPVHVLARDEQSGGLLRALLEAVADELAILEGDIDELFDSWFIETCPEWVVPYIADLVGVTDLPPDLTRGKGVGVSRRAFVANTVAYRRRKGTAAVIEQVARDVTGWPARAVEYYRLLAASTQVDHVRLDRPATARLRTPAASSGPLELVPIGVAQGSLDPLAHTADVRRIARGRGRYDIGNVGVFLFPDQVYRTGWAPARPPVAPAAGWSVHPLGVPTPLFAVPASEQTIESLATEADLPVPLRPRRLLALLARARAGAAASEPEDGLPIAIRVDGADLDPVRIRVRGLEDIAPLPGWQVFVDAVSGRVHPYSDGAPAMPKKSLDVQHCYGGTAEVGAGTYERSAVHAQVLADDPYPGDPARGGPGVRAQVAVLVADPHGLATTSVHEALGDAETAWAGADSPAGATYVVAVGDNATYPGDLTVHLPAATRLVLVAASWHERVLGPGEVLPAPVGVYGAEGLRPHVQGTLTVTGDGGSSLVLDGLVIEGDVLVGPGMLGSLAVSQCTVAGGISVGTGAVATNPGVVVQVVRSTSGAIAFGPAATSLDVRDSVIDPDTFTPANGGAADRPAVTGEGLALHVDGSTLRGAVAVRTLDATSAVLDGPVVVEDRQTGCVRYSFVEPGSRVPRRYRCAPDESDPSVRPVYAAVNPGSPHYLALAPGCPTAVSEGGEGASEMGVHHYLQRPVRVRAAARLLAPYVPVGLEIGIAAPVATGRS